MTRTTDTETTLMTYLKSASLHEGSRRKTKSKSKSFSVVFSSISTLSADRPWEEPFKSNRL
ncbi:hypothetical protein Mapa_005369 [Marchantia paleacea]|nr:hypothetical protein Mapa_005369 [Marchantia paleacea]